MSEATRLAPQSLLEPREPWQLRLLVRAKLGVRQGVDLVEHAEVLAIPADGGPHRRFRVDIRYRIEPRVSLFGDEREVFLAVRRPDRRATRTILAKRPIAAGVSVAPGAPWLEIVRHGGKKLTVAGGPVTAAGFYGGAILLPWPSGGFEILPVKLRAYAPEKIVPPRIVLRITRQARYELPIRLDGAPWTSVDRITWHIRRAGRHVAAVADGWKIELGTARLEVVPVADGRARFVVVGGDQVGLFEGTLAIKPRQDASYLIEVPVSIRVSE